MFYSPSPSLFFISFFSSCYSPSKSSAELRFCYNGIRADWARAIAVTMSKKEEIVGLTEGVNEIRTQLNLVMADTTKRCEVLETQQTQFSSQLQETQEKNRLLEMNTNSET